MISLTIPLEPPSANHYKKPSRRGKFLSFYLTPEALAWHEAVRIVANGATVEGKQHALEYRVYQGKGSRGDADNYAKVVGDSLQRAGVLRNDNTIVEIHGYKFRDRENPRTEIILRAIDQPKEKKARTA